jgi:hypothetical protein
VHHGMLLLEELLECRQHVFEILCQPLEGCHLETISGRRSSGPSWSCCRDKSNEPKRDEPIKPSREACVTFVWGPLLLETVSSLFCSCRDSIVAGHER